MEVKNKGINRETWRLNVVCPHCKAELAIGYKDIKIVVGRKLLRSKVYYTTTCYECHTTNRLKEDEIPCIIRHAILENMSVLDKRLNFYF